MPGTPVRILLARHGETVFNVEGRWQGQTDSPLTERGLAQARELGAALADEPIVAVYSSDLGRAARTAREVAVKHGLGVTTDPRLREVHVGEFAGLNRQEIEAHFGDAIHTWSTAPATMRLPNGETLEDAQRRARAFFSARMHQHGGETIVIITHGAIGQVILVEGLGRPLTDLWLKQRIDNCQISRLEWNGSLRVVDLADVRHLKEVGSLRSWRTTDSSKDVDVA
jgi:probable phosphoglycerate mutase